MISPDLSKMQRALIDTSENITGGITIDATGAETYGTVVALAESYMKPGLLFAGTDDGNLWITHSDGATWEQLKGPFPGLPDNQVYVNRVEPSHFDTLTWYVSFDNHRTNDFTPYLYVTTDGGKSFKSIASTLPTGGPDYVRVIREDPYMRKKGVADELEKDIHKLRVVTERFSSIGSVPALRKENVVTLINNVVAYLRPRISSRIRIEVFTLSDNISALVHAPLFEWVIENLCKNAVDAIGSSGTIAIKILRGSEGKVFIDISDSGKGIPRSKLAMVFKAGFTTKKRGWGLGLTLAKRIIETYHDGKIFVKSSEENLGTTFRISLNAATHSVPEKVIQ